MNKTQRVHYLGPDDGGPPLFLRLKVIWVVFRKAGTLPGRSSPTRSTIPSLPKSAPPYLSTGHRLNVTQGKSRFSNVEKGDKRHGS